MRMRKTIVLGCGLLLGTGLVVSCSEIPGRRKRTPQELMDHNIRQRERDTVRIKGKDEPGQHF